jgi:hydrogenase maturation protease
MKRSGLETMPRVLIVACGNPLRCDDGLAWRAVEDLHRLRQQDVEIIAQHQLTPELASPVSQVERVLFLDAARRGQPGEIRCELVLPVHASGAFTHNFSPASILSLAHELYGKAPQAYVISLSGECFDHGETISATVEAALPGFVELIVRFTEELPRICDRHSPLCL